MDLETFIRNTGEKHFHFLPNEGNAGDGLIHAGFYRLAGRLGLTLEIVHPLEEKLGKNLLIMGAGAFCKASWHKVEAVNHYSTRFENVCILPSTFETALKPVNSMLRKLPANVTVFCRELISYEAVRQLVADPGRVLLDHDLAFELDVTAWKRPGAGRLTAFRTDGESVLKRVPFRNFDISDMGREGNHTLILDIVANFESVYTDRLHVGIAGALLGKEVRIFEGNYHKIRGMYDYSLRDRFPNVVLCGMDELKRYLAESDRVALRHNLLHSIRALPYGQKLVSVLKKQIRKRNQLVPVAT